VSLNRSQRGLAARRRGRAGEWRAALLLMVKGYRILGFRLKTAQAEIDLLAVRGSTLCVVEVKHRADIAQALEAVGDDQRERLRRAGLAIAAGRPALRRAVVRLDLIALAPGRLPMHLPDAWKGA
jgi:putative endonuclease